MTTYENTRMSQAQIIRNENGFDTATITFADDKADLRTVISAGASITLAVKDASESGSPTTIFGGTIRYVTESHPNEFITAKCDGAGYALAEMLCSQEYGTQSSHPTLDTIKEILTDTSYGIVPCYVNSILNVSGSVSGYSYTTEIETITDIVGYLLAPLKPCQKVLEDLCDLISAKRSATVSTEVTEGACVAAGGKWVGGYCYGVGPHWIVTPASKILLSTIGTHHAAAVTAGWTTYYGGSQAAATLTQGTDFSSYSFDTLTPEANHIAYYGNWRRPSSGDGWTEGTASLWSKESGTETITNDTVTYKVGSKSIRVTQADATPNNAGMSYPYGGDATWSFSIFPHTYIPTLNFYILKHWTTPYNYYVFLESVGASYFYRIITSDLTSNDVWYHENMPLGPYYRSKEEFKDFTWLEDGNPNWNNIHTITIEAVGAVPQDDYFCVDGLYFGDVPICRIAKNSTNITAHNARMKVIVDNVGKDDTLSATDDSGTMAQLAYAELLRCQTTPMVGKVTVPMLRGAWPGMLVHVHAKPNSAGTWQIDKDFRITQINHTINVPDGYLSALSLSDDVLNHKARQSFTDLNAVFADLRPEFQDRQAASIKAGTVDISVVALALETDYPS